MIKTQLIITQVIKSQTLICQLKRQIKLLIGLKIKEKNGLTILPLLKLSESNNLDLQKKISLKIHTQK
ncbi:Topoisomerase I damage affected protein 11 [Frankliniella fusca]|uniref:Topoisomerase I damage affected protein 11 n=1 Tax=Frankliniella fusca TaxID=407009 RepID=A0AAE1L7T6_9NEOP|nr:Topoisomerase I damage affected protein 11 [Frankliniella fusca]